MKRSLNNGITIDSKRTKPTISDERNQLHPTLKDEESITQVTLDTKVEPLLIELTGKYMINLRTQRLEIKSNIDALDYTTTDLIKPFIPPAPLKARILELISKVTANGSMGLKKIPLIHEAIRYGYDDVALFLMESGDKCKFKTDRNGQNILHVAVESNRIDIVKKILNWNTDLLRDFLTEKDKERFTPIEIAIKKGHVDLFRLLNAHHEKLAVYTDKKRLTFIATQYGQAKFLPFCLSNIDPNDYSTLQTALCIAIFNDRADCAKLMVDIAKKSECIINMQSFIHASINAINYQAKDFIPYDQIITPSISPDMMARIVPDYTGNKLLLEYALNFLKNGILTPTAQREEQRKRVALSFSLLIYKCRKALSFEGLIEVLTALHTHRNAGLPLIQLIDSLYDSSLACIAGFAWHKEIVTNIIAAYQKNDLDKLRDLEQEINNDEKALDHNFSGKSELRQHIQKTLKYNLNKTIEELISELDNKKDLHKIAEEIERKYEESRSTGDTSDLLRLLQSVKANYEKALPAINAMTLEFCGSTVEGLSQHCSSDKENVIILETPRKKTIENDTTPTRRIPISF